MILKIGKQIHGSKITNQKVVKLRFNTSLSCNKATIFPMCLKHCWAWGTKRTGSFTLEKQQL
jgi:hypothetical protein